MTEDDLQAIEAQLIEMPLANRSQDERRLVMSTVPALIAEVRRLRAILQGSETAMEQLGLSAAAKLFSDMREGTDKKWQLP